MSKFWSEEEALWSFALYGTAIGAGTLFLPIQLGSADAVVLLITALVVQPLTCWPHKTLCQFILSSKTSAGERVIGAIVHYYGKKVGSLITILYLITFFVVVLIYTVATTNSPIEQLAKHITIDLRTRTLVSPGVVLVLNLIFLMNRQVTTRVMGSLVFPLVAYSLFLSPYLTGSQQPTLLTGQMSFDQYMLRRVWISIPVMVFAFSHIPIISTFVTDRREKYGEQAMGKCKKIMKVTHVIICLSVLFFVFSCLLSIPTNCIENAKNKGVAILSTLSMMPNAPAWLLIPGITIAVVTMSKSFLSTCFGVIEGATEVVRVPLHQVGVKKSQAFNRILSIMSVSAIMFTICCINPSAISMIYAIGGPLIAMILLIMPTLFTYLISALKPYHSVGNLITPIVDLLCIFVMFFGQNVLFNDPLR